MKTYLSKVRRCCYKKAHNFKEDILQSKGMLRDHILYLCKYVKNLNIRGSHSCHLMNLQEMCELWSLLLIAILSLDPLSSF